MMGVLNTSVAAVGTHPSGGAIIGFVLSGLGVVIGTLILLAVLTMIMGKLFIVFNKSGNQPVKAMPASSQNTKKSEDEEELVAVLTAAAWETLGKPVRIIRFAPSESQWYAEGRKESHQSHNLR